MNIATSVLPSYYDRAPHPLSFQEEVLAGLMQRQKTLPCKLFYDAYGSQLFDRICELEEYYPTRTEMAIMQDRIEEMAACLGPRCLLVEYGSGSSLKTRILLDHLREPVAYVPVDISREHLMRAGARIRDAYRNLRVVPVCADYTEDVALPDLGGPDARTVVYFPGSTIGNFTPEAAQQFLSRIARVCGPRGGLLIGVDLKKDVQTLERAYNDARGVTAAFNLNILRHINRVLGSNFRLDRFAHHAFYNACHGRIEMHLVSLVEQQVQVGEAVVSFAEGETIHTENSYKYSLDGFAALAEAAGLKVEQVWTDDRQQFSVQYLAVR